MQRLSAAGGVRHVERNDAAVPLTFVQMWLAPLDPGGDPAYEIVRGIADSTPYAVPEAGAMLHVRRLTAGERTAVPDGAYVYVHVVRGEVDLDGERLGPGDAARVTDAEALDAVAVTRARCWCGRWRGGDAPSDGWVRADGPLHTPRSRRRVRPAPPLGIRLSRGSPAGQPACGR